GATGRMLTPSFEGEFTKSILLPRGALMYRPPTLAATALAVAALTAPALHAQLGDLVKQKVKAKAQQSASQGIDEALKQGENAVKCAVTDQACIKNAKTAGKTVVVTDAQGKPVSKADSDAAIAAATGGTGSAQTTAPTGAPSNAPGAPVASAKPGEGAWANYDFVPGERVLFFEDFTKDTVGDFPRRLEFKRG